MDTESLDGSHVPVLGFDKAVLLPEQPPIFRSGLSCSNMAKASISACSDVNIKELKEPEAELIFWPCGSIDATENPRPPVTVDIGDSVCLFSDKDDSEVWSSKLVYIC